MNSGRQAALPAVMSGFRLMILKESFLADAMLKRLLAHPRTRGMDLDSPETTWLRRSIVVEKGFLRRLYHEWYGWIRASLPPGPGAVLEVGSGGGFLADHLPEAVTSEVFFVPHVDVVADAMNLPFADGALRAVVMVDVFHHLCDCRRFLAEAARCVRPGGVCVMIEPWVTWYSRRVFSALHHEPCAWQACEWEFPPAGPLSGANQALPWMVFCRDRDRFEQECRPWTVTTIRPDMPFSYLVSGGVSMRSLMPGALYRTVRAVERLVAPARSGLALFALVVLTRGHEDPSVSQ